MGYTPTKLWNIWCKGRKIRGNDPDVWRCDRYGRTIRCDHYGNKRTQYSWTVDHIVPKKGGGTKALENLQPLHWKSNQEKAAKRR